MVSVGTFNFGEMKEKRLTLVTSHLYENHVHAKLLEAAYLVLLWML